LQKISNDHDPWIRYPLPVEDATRSGLILYHRGFLKDFFLTDAEGEAALGLGLQDEATATLSQLFCRTASGKQKSASLPREATQLPNINIELTNRCTAKCKYCYLGQGKKSEDISTPLLDSVLTQAMAMGLRQVSFTGGEPTLDPRLVDLTARMISSRIHVNILTNGDLITKELISKFEAVREESWLSGNKFDLCPSCGIQIPPFASDVAVCPTCLIQLHPIMFQVSLDGTSSDIHDHTRGTGSFKRAKDAVHRLVDRGFYVILSQTVSSFVTESDPCEYLDLAMELDAKGIRIGLLEWSGSTLQYPEIIADNDSMFSYYKRVLDSLDTINSGRSFKLMVGEISLMRGALANLIHKRGCLFCKTVHLKANGNLVACPFCPSPDFDLGNLSTVSLKDALKLKAKRAKNLVSIADSVAICKGCLFRDICNGGCRGNALNKYGTLDTPDPYCGFYRRFFTYIIATLERFPGSPRNLTYAALTKP